MSTKSGIRKILTGSAITVMLPGSATPFTMSNEHKLFKTLLEALKTDDLTEVQNVIDVANKIETISAGKVTIKDGEVYVGDEVVHNLLAERILQAIELDLPFDFMARFLENLMQNPSFQSRQELYLFMENGNMPITEDGRLLAYKWVREDLYDVHSGTFLNKVGAVIEMARAKVNDDRRVTCSAGLHVCTHAYTQFGQRLLLVAVNPADVVSVPNDYNNAKMRVCKYEVIEEIKPDQYGEFQTAGVYAGPKAELSQDDDDADYADSDLEDDEDDEEGFFF